MAFLTILALGALHGLQPDHAAAAVSLAARTGTPAWQAALRIAAGHAGALALAAVVLAWAPQVAVSAVEPVADALAGASLVVLGALLLLQFARAQYLVHAHHHAHGGDRHAHLHAHAVGREDGHEHGHAKGALALGLLLGISGARTLVVLLPAMGGAGTGVAAVAVYCGGIAMTGLATSAAFDGLRRVGSGASARFIDLAAGCGALATGAWLVHGAMS